MRMTAILLVLALASGAAAADRTVLFGEFTSTG